MRLVLLFAAVAGLWAQNKPGGIPVVVDGTAQFEVFGSIEDATPEQRAQLITERIARIGDNLSLKSEDIRAAKLEGAAAVALGDNIIMFVTDADAAGIRKRKADAATYYADKARLAIDQYRARRQLSTILRGAAYAAAAILFMAIVIYLLWRFEDRVQNAIERYSTAKSVRVQKAELLSAKRIRDLASGTVTLLTWIITLGLLFLAVPAILEFFPVTAPWADNFYASVLETLSALASTLAGTIPNLIVIAATSVMTYGLLRIIKFFFRQIRQENIRFRGFYPEWAIPTYNLIRILIIALAAVVIFPYLPGAKSPAFQGISVFVGLLVSLSASGAISNVVSGAILTYMRSLRLGDRVRVGETEGDVIELTLLITRIRTIKNVIVTLPNALVLGSQVINYSATVREGRPLILHTTITIGYDAPWRTVHELMIDAALATDGIAAEPAPFVFQTALNDFNVAYQINAFTNDPWSMADIYAQLHSNIQEKFNAAGVEIMSPNYFALRDGNTVTIPESQRPAGYVTPGFEIRLPGTPR
jgi:small-conductance mechanosensitive channel